ncbi:hypothetical protein TYRP_013462 [Tyrophagus putrescentiae]|nr:hypothetical protein TYRP_013462 [Tyrophagus putrescentiae]
MSASLKKSATRKSLPEISDDDLQSALSWQQIQLLFWDIDNLEELYKGAVAKYNLGSEKATRLLTRANVSLQRLDEWASQVLSFRVEARPPNRQTLKLITADELMSLPEDLSVVGFVDRRCGFISVRTFRRKLNDVKLPPNLLYGDLRWYPVGSVLYSGSVRQPMDG